MASAGTPYRLVPAHFYPWPYLIACRHGKQHFRELEICLQLATQTRREYFADAETPRRPLSFRFVAPNHLDRNLIGTVVSATLKLQDWTLTDECVGS